MPYYADIYILIDSREPEFVNKLLAEFLSGRPVERQTEYDVSLFYNDKPEETFYSAQEVMRFMEQNPHHVYSIYWHSDSSSKKAGVWYTDDGAMILGIACEAETEEDQLLLDLKKYFSADYGYITYEQPPPHNREEFITMSTL